jgi:hypothetical protein
MARTVHEYRRAASTAKSATDLARMGGQYSGVLSPGTLDLLGSLSQGLGVGTGLLGAIGTATNEQLPMAQRVGGGLLQGAQAANSAANLAGYTVPYLSAALPWAGLAYGVATGDTHSDAGQTAMAANVASTLGGAISGALGAGPAGALVAAPLVLGGLFGRGGIWGRKPVAPDLYELGQHTRLGPSITAGRTPDPSEVRKAGSLEELSYLLGTDRSTLLGAIRGTDPNALGTLSTIANHYTTPEGGQHYFAPPQAPLARLLNPDTIGYYNPLAALTNPGSGHQVGPTLDEHIRSIASGQTAYEKNRAEAVAMGIAPSAWDASMAQSQYVPWKPPTTSVPALDPETAAFLAGGGGAG